MSVVRLYVESGNDLFPVGWLSEDYDGCFIADNLDEATTYAFNYGTLAIETLVCRLEVQNNFDYCFYLEGVSPCRL